MKSSALLSVWDKRGIVELARQLSAAGLELLSTGSTAATLRGAGLEVTDVSARTGFPEMMDGRVKTLHPAIHAGILARRGVAEDMATLEQMGVGPIDVVVSNLYPFGAVVADPTVAFHDAIENIDIGGPTLARAAAKNHADVVVLSDPDDYADIGALIAANGFGAIDQERRRALAAKVFGHIAGYDALIAQYLRNEESFPKRISVGGELLSTLRYGENPHQQAAVYVTPAVGGPQGIATWQVHADREMSYNNYLDATAAWGCVTDFEAPTVVIVKHTLPCGIGSSDDLVTAYERALAGDPVSAFGGIMACNRTVTEDVVTAIGKQRFDVMLAPAYEPAALEQLLKRSNLRVITVGDTSPQRGWDYRSVHGGLLVQAPDQAPVDPASWRCVTQVQPSAEQLEALAFAWRAAKWVKSNAIVLARPNEIVGVGAGQPNRVESVRIAVKIAGERSNGAVLASDAFFPFADGVEAAIAAGVVAIAQPGGSVRDEEVIAACDAHGVAMLLTGQRHFRH